MRNDPLDALIPPVVVAVSHVPPSVRAPLSGYSLIATLLWLAGSLSILALSWVMTVDTKGRVYLPEIATAVPETCALRYRFGLDCPGCGLTRAFIHFANGQWTQGVYLNAVGLLIFLFVVVQIPAAVLRLSMGRQARPTVYWTRFNEVAIIALTLLCILQWILKLTLGAWI